MARRTRATDPKKTSTKPKAAPVEVRNIAHPKVWKTALAVANGNMALLTVDSFARVTVTLP